jgi:hypothetical protein
MAALVDGEVEMPRVATAERRSHLSKVLEPLITMVFLGLMGAKEGVLQVAKQPEMVVTQLSRAMYHQVSTLL